MGVFRKNVVLAAMAERRREEVRRYREELRTMTVYLCPGCGDTWRGYAERLCRCGTLMEAVWSPGASAGDSQ